MSWHVSRYFVWYASGAASIGGIALIVYFPYDWWSWCLTALFFALFLLGSYDYTQTRHSIRRNYPIIGNLRFLLEYIRPEIRQYFLEDDLVEAPFSRNQRSIVYQRAKGQMDKRAFGTQKNVYENSYEWITHSMHPTVIDDHDFRIQVGSDQCTKPYNASIFNISAMSFGALSANAVRALNKGALIGKFAHDTGEGGISRYHKEHGGDLIWNIGSGYYGCHDPDGFFSEERFVANANLDSVKMIEIKLSQGAKPGQGGILPASKVTPEIAEAREVPVGVDCLSPASHSAFSTPIELMLFVQRLRTLSQGKPVGFKLCIGHPWEWFALVKAMLETKITPDFIVIDGAEGGTGAAPVEFCDHVGTPLRDALWLVHNTLVGVGLRSKIRLGASGKIISAFDIARTLAIGADWCNSARGFLFALGCIQAQTCHTGTCPTGVTTQDPDRQRALVVPDKAERVASFHNATLEALGDIIAAAGLMHPNEITADHIVRRISTSQVKTLSMIYQPIVENSIIDGHFPHPVFTMYWDKARPDSFKGF